LKGTATLDNFEPAPMTNEKGFKILNTGCLSWFPATGCHLYHRPHHQCHPEETSSLSSRVFEELGLLASLDALTQALGQVSAHQIPYKNLFMYYQPLLLVGFTFTSTLLGLHPSIVYPSYSSTIAP